MPLSTQCEAGCMSFDGGEVKHHRDCVHYPESLTKLWHDTEAEYQVEIERLCAALSDIADGMGEASLADIGRFAPIVARNALKQREA